MKHHQKNTKKVEQVFAKFSTRYWLITMAMFLGIIALSVYLKQKTSFTYFIGFGYITGILGILYFEKYSLKRFRKKEYISLLSDIEFDSMLLRYNIKSLPQRRKINLKFLFAFGVVVFLVLAYMDNQQKYDFTDNIASEPQGYVVEEARMNIKGYFVIQDELCTGSTITIRNVSAESETSQTYESCEFSVNLKLNQEYIIRFSKNGFLSKEIIVDTRICNSDFIINDYYQIEVVLKANAKHDASINAITVGKIAFNQELNDFDRYFLDTLNLYDKYTAAEN